MSELRNIIEEYKSKAIRRRNLKMGVSELPQASLPGTLVYDVDTEQAFVCIGRVNGLPVWKKVE